VENNEATLLTNEVRVQLIIAQYLITHNSIRNTNLIFRMQRIAKNDNHEHQTSLNMKHKLFNYLINLFIFSNRILIL